VDARSYARELRPLFGQAAAYARALLRDKHDAEDAVQQASLRAWERIHRYDATRPFKGWWFAVLRNCCVDIQRGRQTAPTENLEDVEPADDRPVEIGDWSTLEDALARLSILHREILRLRYFGELSYDELAEALSIPRGTVMSRLHLARKALAALIPKEDV
jgi:RNA polymerase sigma-70 factor, ECF subfamily